MRIANLVLTSTNGGLEQAFIDYSIAIKNLGHEVFPITKNDAPYFSTIVDLGFEVKKISNKFGYYDIFSVKQLTKILLEKEIDVVFAHAGRSMSIARKSIKKINKIYQKNQEKFGKKIFLISVNHSDNVKRSIDSDFVLSVNKQIFYKTIDLGQKADSSFVISNGISVEDAYKTNHEVNLTNKENINLGCIGRLDRAKGFIYAILALKELENFTEKKFTLKIAGLGDEEKNLRKIVKDLNLEDRVNFCGWINKKDFFDSIDIFIFTSKKETFGLVILESMKYCKPIIASKTDGSNEILRDNIDALMFNPKQTNEEVAKDIKAKILRLVYEEDLLNSLVDNALNRLKEKFSYKNLEQKLAEIIGTTQFKKNNLFVKK